MNKYKYLFFHLLFLFKEVKMKIILAVLTTLIFTSLATAENEAVYDLAAGSVEIPVLSVKEQTDKFSVILHQQDTENLIFSVTDAEPNSLVDSFTNEATYDPETGVVIIPTVMVLEEGNPIIKNYSVELQLTEESIFEVKQAEEILSLPTNLINGVAVEKAGFLSEAKVASKWCTGNSNQNLGEARQNFKTKCGESWNDQKGHVCDYKSDGYHCNGNTSASGSSSPSQSPAPATNTSASTSNSARCSGNPSQNIDEARQNFKTKCGEPWNDQKGHVCDYKQDGYHCNGNVSASTTPAPTSLTTSTTPASNPDWCTGTPDYNIDEAKRNFARSCGQTWNDQLGHVCKRQTGEWHCSGTTSGSAAFIPTAPSGVKTQRWHPRVVFIKWDTEAYVYQRQLSGFKIFRNGNYIVFVGKNESSYVDRNAIGSPKYQIVAVGANNMSSPSSRIADTALNYRGRDEVSNVRREIRNENGEVVRVAEGVMIESEQRTTIDAVVKDTSGNSLGTVHVEDNGSSVFATTRPEYGENAGRTTHSDLRGGLDLDSFYANEFISQFPSKPQAQPPQTTPGEGGEGPNPTNPTTTTGPANPTTTGPNGITPSW